METGDYFWKWYAVSKLQKGINVGQNKKKNYVSWENVFKKLCFRNRLNILVYQVLDEVS